MANLMHRFLRSKSCFSPIQRLAPSLTTFQKKPYIESVFEKPDPDSLANPVITISGDESDYSMRFYPSFSMGYFMNSSIIQCPDLPEISSLEEKAEKEIVIYADSVKKKRKKKMNKHKYRKLRKRLGRKS